ncbi:MAG: deoxyribose-phosphate aldolase [candidate division WOR-3 bacterium]|nr:deoxyribose-phosphate aldolase [candidate division WOR-3 bacterium]MCX7757664.1 deoxyribose-phosphate aldolase [candidate division WOR-3 bacterium]MDW7987468.1 deoxyribose-phosphate aldolase [candidate division WOR-3 bacterium]
MTDKLTINKYIDHTLLKPEASIKDIKKLCAEAKKYKFATVFVNPSYVKLAAQLLKGSGVNVGCAVGFPLGATTTDVKVFEAKEAVKNGAQEIDMVINIGRVKSKDFKYVEDEIKKVVRAVAPIGVKVILETCLLTDEEKIKVAKLALKAGAQFVKTSTGFSSGGATVEDVKLLYKAVNGKIGVKASGGIRDYKTALKMIEAGATRIGTSAGVQIVTGGQEKPSMEKY